MKSWLLCHCIIFCQFILKCSPEVFHNYFAIEVQPHIGAKHVDDLAQELGFVNLGQIGDLKNHYLLEHPHVHKRSAQPSHDHHEHLDQHPHVVWFEQQKELKRSKRDNSKNEEESKLRSKSKHHHYKKRLIEEEESDFNDIIPDPLFPKQWFLNQGAVDGSDMNVFPAWRKGKNKLALFSDF